MKPIRVITQDFELLTEIDNYESLSVIRRWHGIGEIDLRINRYMNGVDKLNIGELLIVGSDLHKVYIVQHKEIELDEDGKASENLVIKAPALKELIRHRPTIPPTNIAYDTIESDAETVMKHYVSNNVVNTDAARVIPKIEIAPNQNRGPIISWNSRYKNLSEELREQGLVSGLGWNVSLDISNQKWVFDVMQGRDLTASQSHNPRVIFSPHLDSLKTLSYSDSLLNYKNVAIVAGPGEGVDRVVTVVGDAQGVDRREVFIDARDIQDETNDDPPQERPLADIIADLTSRGEQKLVEMAQERYLEGEILTKSPFVYEKDFDLGDVVTTRIKDWGVTMDARITEIKEIYEVDGFKLEATFGNDQPTLVDKIKNGFDRIENELTK